MFRQLNLTSDSNQPACFGFQNGLICSKLACEIQSSKGINKGLSVLDF